MQECSVLSLNFLFCHRLLIYKKKSENTKINKNINENIDGVNPKIISGELLLKDLSLGFVSNKEVLFQRLNCTIPSGSIVVINGFNSAGKLLYVRLLIGLIKPLKGSILFDNIDIK